MSVFLQLYIGFYLLYLLSEKSKKKVQIVSCHPQVFKIIAYLLFISGLVELIHQYGSSVGLVSWWIFTSPILFILILGQAKLKR